PAQRARQTCSSRRAFPSADLTPMKAPAPVAEDSPALPIVSPEPPRDCPLCPRLVEYRRENQRQNPGWFNGAAPSFGDPHARLLVAGLAPGRTGANRTGRPFTGDGAGWILYETLIK